MVRVLRLENLNIFRIILFLVLFVCSCGVAVINANRSYDYKVVEAGTID